MNTLATRQTAAEFLRGYTWPRTEAGKIDKAQVEADIKHLFCLEADRVRAACYQAMEIEKARAEEQLQHLMLDVKFDGAAETFGFRIRQAIRDLQNDALVLEALRQFEGCLETATFLKMPCASHLETAINRAHRAKPPTWRDFHNGLYTGWQDKVREALAPAIDVFEREEGQIPLCEDQGFWDGPDEAA
ncbi:MAG TPA: hypothetical protein VG944_13145 [Fimbriimonas sp.]|nr:hypothetical protein [Fimbriimonas sp.]